VSDLLYRAGVLRADLGESECTIAGQGGPWLLSFCFRRKTDSKLETRVIPVNPNGVQGGPFRAWALTKVGPGRWQLFPSIKCLEQDADGKDIETWHEQPCLIEVPDDEVWTHAGRLDTGSPA
jgi:hypothetical protein